MRGAWYLIPFSLMWGGFAIFWEVTAISSRAPFFFWLWGIPFVAVGLYMIFGRILVARREAARTFYAITDRRVLVQSGAFRQTFTEFDLRDLPGSQLEERSDGSGTITLGPVMGWRAPPGWPLGGMFGRTPALEAVQGVGRVYQTLQDAKAAAREASTTGGAA
jgi:Bacterial PH domain